MGSYFKENKTRIISELSQWLSIPTISALPEFKPEIKRGTQWLSEHLEGIGLNNVEIIPTEQDAPPIVYADWLEAGSDKPTVLIYGHYDVQPADPIDEWVSAPFDPQVRDDKIYARGANDNKGQHFIILKAIEALLSEDKGKLPNIKLFLEGEEEVGGTHLEEFIKENSKKLSADICLIADTPMLGPDQPSIITGLRGLVYMELIVNSAKTDMHSGHYGGNVHNPIQVLSWILSKLKDENGKVLIPYFYDDVKEWSPKERAKINEVTMSEGEIIEHTGVRVLFGEEEYSPIERFGIRPTLDINGIWGGFSGEGPKTVIPKTAGAKVSIRMVAHQDPEKIEQSFKDYVTSITPKGVDIKFKTYSKEPAIIIDPSNKYFQTAVEALKDVFGKEPKFVMEGGSIPVGGHIKKYLDIDTIYMGFGLPDDNLHAPNEKFNLGMLDKGIETTIKFLKELT